MCIRDSIQQCVWQTFLLEAADKGSAIPLLLCCNTRPAQLRRLRLQFQCVLATLRAGPAMKQIFIRSAFLHPFYHIITPNSAPWFLSPQRFCTCWKFWNPRWFRREMPCRVNPVTCGDMSILRSIQNSEKSVQRMTLILGVNIPWGMAKRSISSRSPNSLSIKRYEVHPIRDTKSRYFDERLEVLISQLNLSFFVWFFRTWFASLSSTRYLGRLIF